MKLSNQDLIICVNEMTKAQALAEFREYILPLIYEQYGKGDVIAKREEWNNFTDALCKDRRITDWQYNNWSNPF